MQKKYAIFMSFLSLFLFSQKNEKIKASKIVTISQKELINFKELELWNKLDVLLIKGNSCNLEIEADDNLHETFVVKNIGKKIIISNDSKISGAKKMQLKLNYNDSLQSIILKDDVKVSAIEDLVNENITIATYDDSKIKIGIKNKNITINCNDDSEMNLEMNTENCVLNILNNAEFSGNLICNKATINLIDKSSLKLEGTSDELKLSSKDSSNFSGKNFITSSTMIAIKNKAEAEINCKNKLIINAVNSSKIEIFGSPKFEIESFDGNAILQKKGF